MEFMRWLGLQNLMRLAAGGALLVLLAAQEKVCAWPIIEAEPVHRVQNETPADGKDENKPEPVTFANTLPDPVPPRWKLAVVGEVERTPDEYAVAAWSADGGPRPAKVRAAVVSALADLLAILRQRLPDPLELRPAAQLAERTPPNQSLLTAIQQTGPPRV